MAFIPSRPNKEIVCLVTVDGDLRLGDRWQQKACIKAMRQVHNDLGLLGKTSWFINEADFHWTGQHPELLVEFVRSGECIGVHDHQDTYFAEQYAEVFKLMQDSRSRLASFFRSNEMDVPLLAHRNGCAIQSPAFYQAAIDLGYTLVSDVRPEVAWYARMIVQDGQWTCLTEGDPRSVFCDNRSIPLGSRPWYHGAQNWMDYTSALGPLLQVPVTSLPWVEPARVSAAVEKSSQEAVIVIDTHPYDLQDPCSHEVSLERLVNYRDSLSWIEEKFDPVFIRMDQLPEKLYG